MRNWPARRSALVVGSSSMSSLRHLAPYTDDITTVEIDRMVAEAGRRYLANYNQLHTAQEKWTLVIDDDKHFLSSTDKRFDLVIVDVPAPWYIQTGLLFTREFYELVKSRLAPDGILSVYVTQTFSLNRPQRVSSHILAALLATFDELMVVNEGEAPYGFFMAGDPLGFTLPLILLAGVLGFVCFGRAFLYALPACGLVVVLGAYHAARTLDTGISAGGIDIGPANAPASRTGPSPFHSGAVPAPP